MVHIIIYFVWKNLSLGYKRYHATFGFVDNLLTLWDSRFGCFSSPGIRLARASSIVADDDGENYDS